MAEFRYLRATEWGMRWAKPPATEKLNDPEVFVHHSAGGRMSTDAATAFRALNEYAITGKGYSALDYDILVHRNTSTGLITIGEGRGPWRSAATLDRNEEGEAICVMGYFHPGHKLSEQPHPDEVEGVALGIVWGMELGWIARDAKILGHRDNPAHPGATGCPGDYLYAYMQTIRDRVAALLAPPTLPEGPALKYFKVSDSPSTIWQYIDGTFLAVRLDGETATARGVDVGAVPKLAAAEAAKFTYQTGLPFISVR